MIRDSEKYRGVDMKLEYSNINDKKYSVKIEAVIISQKLNKTVKEISSIILKNISFLVLIAM